MNCALCQDFDRLQAIAATMEPYVPGLGACINAFHVWHLSVMHGLSFPDVAVEMLEPPDRRAAAIRAAAPTQQP